MKTVELSRQDVIDKVTEMMKTCSTHKLSQIYKRAYGVSSACDKKRDVLIVKQKTTKHDSDKLKVIAMEIDDAVPEKYRLFKIRSTYTNTKIKRTYHTILNSTTEERHNVKSAIEKIAGVISCVFVLQENGMTYHKSDVFNMEVLIDKSAVK